jgi:hypothetical protein
VSWVMGSSNALENYFADFMVLVVCINHNFSWSTLGVIVATQPVYFMLCFSQEFLS